MGRFVLVLTVFYAAGGCEGPATLPVTPNALRDGSGSQVLEQAPAECRTPDMNVLYVTDRVPLDGKRHKPSYGYERSLSLAYGEASVSLDPSLSWDELVKLSGSKPDGRRFVLKVPTVHETGRVLVSVESLEVVDGKLQFRPEVNEDMLKQQATFIKLLESRLALTPKKDVYIYVHGVSNSFDDAMCRAGVMWHYIGRQGVFIAYAWPAGRGGMMGYFYDRESGEYTVLHLKKLLEALAQSPVVERIHIIAHSRGADVSTTALRELNIAYRARGEDPQKALKLETLVLAAADLDAQVFSLRLLFENMAGMAHRIVVYSSSMDKAVGLADWLFSSSARLGTLSKDQIKPAGQKLLAELPNIQFVRCHVSGFGTTHDYVFTHPAALSDLILVLRDGKAPGEIDGRPLKPLGGAFWQLENDYARPDKK
jgi:esterase/lipase superfamily enzyme